MPNRLRKVPVGRTIPAVPGTPEVPAYCVDEPVYSDFGQYSRTIQQQVYFTQLMTGMKIGQGYFGQIGTDTNGRPVYGLKVVSIPPDLSAMFSGPVGSPLFVWYYLRTCYPRIPAVRAIPARVEYQSVPGWNSGGRSVGGFAANGYAEFYIGPSNIASVVGISTTADTTSPSDCSHAFYGYQGNLQVYENGVAVHTVSGGLASNPRLRIVRTNGTVRYFVNDELVHTSAKTSSGYAYIDASLYAIGDYVDSPLVGATNAGKAVAAVGVTMAIDPRLRAVSRVGISASARGRAGSTFYSAAVSRVGIEASFAGTAENFGAAVSSVGIATTAAAARNACRVVVPSVQALGGESSYAQGSAVFRSGYGVEAYGGLPIVEFAYGAVQVPQPMAGGFCLSGGTATGAVQVPKGLSIGADYPYAQAELSYRGKYTTFGYGAYLAPDAAELSDLIAIDSTFELYADVPLSFFSSVEVSDGLIIELEISEGLGWFEALMVTDSISELSDQNADWSDTVYVTDQSSDFRNAVTQLAVNAATAAPVEYTNFNFMKILHTPSGSYGLREDGVYRIGGGSDAGEPRTAYVDLGNPDLGSVSQKHTHSVFFGLSTDGQVMATLRDDSGVERTYRVIERRGYHRMDAARGVISKNWRLRLEIIDATEADVNSIEFVISTTEKTRWTR